MVVRQTVLLLFVLLYIVNAQLLSNPRRVYTNPTDGTVIKHVGAAATACSTVLAILDNSTRCFKYANADGVVYNSLDCSSSSTLAAAQDLKDAFEMVIYASAGYTVTPTGRLVILDMYSGQPIDVITSDQTQVPFPQRLTLYSSFAVPTLTHTWVMANNASNTTLYLPNWTVTPPAMTNSYGSAFITQLNNTTPIKCFIAQASGQLMIVFEGDQNVYMYSSSAAGSSPVQKFLGSFGGFGNIGACAADFYNRVYIWDTSDSKLKVLNSTGFPLYNLTLPDVAGVPKRIYPTRNKVFFHDNLGVMRYDLPPMQVNFITPTEPTCPTGGSFARFEVTGGSPPYYPRIIPDQVSFTSAEKIPSFTLNYTFSNLNVLTPYNATFNLYDDVVAPEFEAFNANGGDMSTTTPASVFPPKAGLYSWRMLMASSYQYQLRVSTTLTGGKFMTNFFSTIEMWVNVGAGLGKWTLDFTGGSTSNYYYFNYDSGDFVPNTWTKLSFDLSKGQFGTSTRITFIDYTNSSSTDAYLYVDEIRLLPYNTTNRIMFIKDFCNATITTPYIPMTGQNLMKVNVTSKSVSCHASGNPGTKSNNGELNAVVTGGVSPYVSYGWGFSSLNISSLTDLPAFNSNIMIYDNAINSAFTDRSGGSYNLADTTYFRSAPYSISFIPTFSTYLSFYTPNEFTSAKYPSIEFYVHGGTDGKQLLYAGLINSQNTVVNQQLVHRLMGLPSIPANIWTRVSYTIPSGTYNGFVINSLDGVVQSRVYFDDIRIISNEYNITVIDSAGCRVTSYNVAVPTPKPLAVTATVNNLKCFDSTNGSIVLDVSGGNVPYSYNWTNSNTTSSLMNIPFGDYSVTVSDANRCSAIPTSTAAKVVRPPPLSFISRVRGASCYGGRGSVTSQVNGGVEPFSFTWSSSASYNIQHQPAPYSIFSDSVTTPYTLDSRYNSTIVCNGANSRSNGSLSSQGGYCAVLARPPTSGNIIFGVGCPGCIDFTQYSSLKLWVNLFDTQDAKALVAVFTSSDVPVYIQPLNITATLGWQVTTIRLPTTGHADSFTIQKSNGSAWYVLLDSIVLMPIASSSPGIGVKMGFDAIIEGAAGTYTLTVSDGNSCPLSVNYEIQQPSAISVAVNTYPPSVGGENGAASIANTSGGVPPYVYYWTEADKYGDTVEGLKEGTYTLVVTDANGCEQSVPVTISTGVGKLIRPYTTAAATGFGVLIGIGVILACLSIVILAFKWDRFSTYGPFYCGVINLGVVISFGAAAVVLPEPTDALCLAFPWLLGIAFNLVYGCLFIKTWVLYRVFYKASQMKKTNLTPFYILKVLSVFVGIEVVFMLIWTFVDPPKAGYADLLDNRKELQCTNNTPIFWAVFLSVKGAWLLFGAILAFLTRNITKEYNESKSIAYAIYNDIVLIVVAVPLALTLKEVPLGVVVVEAAVVVLSFTFTLLLLFFPIWWKIFFSSVDVTGITVESRKSGNSTSSTGNSPTHSQNTSSKEVYSL